VTMSPFVEEYLAHVWALVPIPRGQKGQCPKPFTIVPGVFLVNSTSASPAK
jgi:hypothetical protein